MVGRPNVGKSTLVNALVGRKVAITSSRPQTTRNTIRGVLTQQPGARDGGHQIVFVDTPGLHRPRTALGERLNAMVGGTLTDADVVALVVDATQEIGPGDRRIAERLQGLETPVVVAVTKIDRARPEQLAVRLAEAGEWDFDAYVPVSGLSGEGLPALRAELVARLPEGPLYFPPDAVTDQPEPVVIAEIVREKFLERLRDEMPHSLVVLVREVEERADGLLAVTGSVVVERSSQKGIVIGRGGRMLRAAGEEARRELESLFGTRVYLDLRVRVEKDWQRRPELLDRLGFRT